VEGKLQTRSWEDKNGGGKRYATEVLCDYFLMLDGRPQGGGEAGGYEPRAATSAGRAPARSAGMGAADEYPDYAPQAPSGGGGSAADDDLPF
jgi:single-strand DNA-binding protein